MPKTVWESKEKKREREQAERWDWVNGQLTEKHISPEDAAEQIGCTPRTFFNYRQKHELPFSKMAKLFGVIKASNEDIIKFVKAWQ